MIVRTLIIGLALAAALAGCGSSGGLDAPAAPSAHAQRGARRAVPRLGPVFLIIGENTGYGRITPDHARYIAGTLRPQGAWLTDDHSFGRSKSLGNYIAMVSGQFIRCEARDKNPGDCRQNVPNLFAQLQRAGKTWRSWQQAMPSPCYTQDSGSKDDGNAYPAHHNPALYFTGLARSCRANDLPMGSTRAGDTSAFDAALAAGRVGDLNLVVPDNCSNGHDACGAADPVRSFDDFVAREVPKIRRSPAFGRRGVVFVTWDEGGDGGGKEHVALVAVGGPVRPGAVDRAPHDHYGLERTLAEGLGVKPLGHARTAAPFATIWR